MEKVLYSMIFKRKSFHIFRDIGIINATELRNIEEAYKTFTPLVSEIKTAIKIVPAEETTCKRLGVLMADLMYGIVDPRVKLA